MNILFALGIVQALFLIFLIGSKNRRIGMSQKILIAWLLTLCGTLLFYYISFSGNIIGFNFLLIIWAIEIVHGPLLFFYTKSWLNSDYRLKFLDVVHFFPYLAIVTLLFYFHYYTENKISIFNGYIIFKEGGPASLKVLLLCTQALTLLYFTYSLHLIKAEVEVKAQFYSDYDHINFLWLKRLLMGVIGGTLINLAANYQFLGFYMPTDYQLAAIGTSVSVAFAFFAGYVNYRHQSDLALYSLMQNSNEKMETLAARSIVNRYKKTGLTSEKALTLTNKLLEFIEAEKPYLNPKVTIRDVSDHLGASTNHVSQVINENMHKNFFTFINEYRVKEFYERIERGHHDNYTLIGVAMDCGFSSKSSFYSVFKKITGMTPADYIRRMPNRSEVVSASS